MFERRLKMLLIIFAVFAFVLLGRAAQVQIVSRGYWKAQAVDALKNSRLVETTRGKLLDRNGKVLALDEPCIDACVEFRALTSPPDKVWVGERAVERLKTRMGEGWSKLTRKQKLAMREEESRSVVSDIDNMWTKLADVSGRSIDDIEEARDAIVRRVRMRQRFVWYERSRENLKSDPRSESDWKKFITDGGDDQAAIDSYHVTVTEELEAHVLLRALDTSIQNQLGKDIDQYPGLILRPGIHRAYPYNDVACHLIGYMTRANQEDLKENTQKNDIRNYLPNDLVGRTGLESLCEPSLRGIRGRIDKTMDDDAVLGQQGPIPGSDVRTTVDIELQKKIQAAFASATIRDSKGNVDEDHALLHGAAVILDVQSNQVLSLVSYPTYDLNYIDEQYSYLGDDDINEPLRNRATASQLEPGSTVKPLCGLAGIAQGVVGLNEGIECTGRLKLDGRYVAGGRCWVSSKFGKELLAAGMSDMHHLIPSSSPHRGHDGNPDGFLTYSDALERSCNIYFETVADRLGIDRLSTWYDRFGLGRPTGIGIVEGKGRLPRNCPSRSPVVRRTVGFYGGIGQGNVAATPIQMANVVAMIARDGVWMRPILVMAGSNEKRPTLRAGTWQSIPERVDLHLPPEGLKAAKLGMWNVVNSVAGTGTALAAQDEVLKSIGVCAKTGTAQAARLRVKMRDDNGRVKIDARGKPMRDFLVPSTTVAKNSTALWYRSTDAKGEDLNHAWCIGFAPANHPKIAFAVMVEYGGSGGKAAAAIAREALHACIARGYLVVPSAAAPPVADAN